MRNNNRKIYVLLLLLPFVMITACKVSYDSMLQDFNNKYFAPAAQKDLSVNDEGFEADGMLAPYYDFYEGYSSSLAGPADAAAYSWKTPVPDSEPVEYRELCKERVFNFMPGKDFATGSETKVILTVTNNAGTEYIDSTIIRINRQLPI